MGYPSLGLVCCMCDVPSRNVSGEEREDEKVKVASVQTTILQQAGVNASLPVLLFRYEILNTEGTGSI